MTIVMVAPCDAMLPSCVQTIPGHTMRPSILFSAFLLAAVAGGPAPAKAADSDMNQKTADQTATESDDSFLWLEEVEGERALNWVRRQNAASIELLGNTEGFDALRDDIQAILDSNDKIAYVDKIGDHFYNFWQDADHPRGIWRRTTLAEYRKDKPAWETVIDVDALNESEGKRWVWHGADCLAPDYQRCLIALSDGGKDADVTREFDLANKRWVKDGFYRPEAKGSLGWIDRDTVFAATDFGEGSMTSSGYSREVRVWKRGTPMNDASLVFEVKPEDLGAFATRDHTKGYERDFLYRIPAIFSNETFLLDKDGGKHKIDVPESAQPSVHREWLLVELRDAWDVGGKSFPAGSLIATKFDAFMAGDRDFTLLFAPSDTTALAGHTWTRHHLVINVMDDVKNRLYVLTPPDGGKAGEWSKQAMPGAPEIGKVSVGAVDDESSDDVFMTVTGFLTPTTLFHGPLLGEKSALKHMPATFDASGFEVSQHFATSKDGTRVPYFQVSKKGMKLDGRNPTLQYGYGGFEISMTPSYADTVGPGWLAQGGVYVLANIRGGGEYGPRWHQAALRENRLRAYEDFAAVSEDLIKRGVTSPEHLGIQGGSNGGLLMGNMTVLYPDLYGAVVCQMPLLDMKRYSHLLAGASWMAEYGDPDTDDWQFIKAFSPYQNVKADVDYPPVFFMSSTRDDRVHPGHARKMMAKMSGQGHDVMYFEALEGGHNNGAENRNRAIQKALAYTYLKQRLFPKD